MIDPPEVFVFGPYIRNMLGKSGTEMPRCACAPSAQASPSTLPPLPRTSIGSMNEVVRKPVPQMMQSTACSRPSAVRSPSGVTRAIASVTSSTFARCSVGRNSELKSTRLQPNV